MKKWHWAVIVVILLLLLLIWSPGSPEETNSFPIANDPANEEDPSLIRLQDGSLLIAYFSEQSEPSNLFIKKSLNGVDWGDPVQASDTPTVGMSPSIIQASDGTLHMVWTEQKPNEWNYNIWYARSEDGLTWTDQTPLTERSQLDWLAAIVEFNGKLRIFWASNMEGPIIDLYTIESDDGVEWSEPRAITNSEIRDDLPIPYVDGDELHLVWITHKEGNFLDASTNIMYSKTSDGVTWAPPTSITNDENYVDTIPSIIETSKGKEIAWVTTRPPWKRGGSVAIPLADPSLDNIREVEANGYSMRTVQTSEGNTLIIWVEHDKEAPDKYNIYGRILDE